MKKYFFHKKTKNMNQQIINTPMHYNLSIQPTMGFNFFFKTPSEKKYGNNTKPVFMKENQTEKNTSKNEFIRCRVRIHKITTHKEKINVNGSHHHTFANPNGIIFGIGCFNTAPGCLYTGPFSEEFSWFKGYMWQVSLCASCLGHIGWLFFSAKNDFFYGLILDRLIDSSE